MAIVQDIEVEILKIEITEIVGNMQMKIGEHISTQPFRREVNEVVMQQ